MTEVWCCCSCAGAVLKPAEGAVAEYAVKYMRIRSWGIMAAMIGFVAAATYRGVKDTKTPLNAAVGAMLTNMVLTPLMLYGKRGLLVMMWVTMLAGSSLKVSGRLVGSHVHGALETLSARGQNMRVAVLMSRRYT